MTSLVHRCVSLIILSFLIVSVVKSVPLLSDTKDVVNYRLPNNTFPIRYDVYLKTEVHQKDFSFDGNVVITFEAKENTSSVTLHYRQIDIIDLKLMKLDGSALFPEKPTYQKDNITEFLTIPTSVPFIQGNQYKVEISYNGTLRSDNQGFYRSSYKNEKDEEVYIATTQFEQTEARHAFPCYDEPGTRAIYSIKIKHHKNFSAISNMRVKSQIAIGDYFDTTFEDTPKMQTYLLAFVVSDFDSIKNSTSSPPQSVYARKAAIQEKQADLALDVGVKVINTMQTHFGVNYTLPKLDQISIPDFYWGAMENWGLVTYREELLLYSEGKSTTKQKEGIIGTIGHEYTHQFFGNLVAPLWWDYTWLNEGFATLYANYLSHLIYPEMRWMDSFVISKVQSVFTVDSKEDIRPMTHYVETPAEITALFDDIAYAKSGSVLRMFQEALGVSTFTKGLRHYLVDMSLKSATSEDLYRGIQKSLQEDGSTVDVKTAMRTWETQSGFPVVTVSRNNDTITISQERFLYSKSDSKSLWRIPLNYVVGSNPDFSKTLPDFWLHEKNMTIKNETETKSWSENDWILFNIQQTGYYRVNYDEDLWNLLIKELNEGDIKKIHVINRAQLIDDSIHLAKADKLNYAKAFEIMNYLKNETDYIPWASASRGFNFFNLLVSGSDYYDHFLQFIRENVDFAFNKLGVNVTKDDTNFDIHARNIAIDWACKSGLEACTKQTAVLLANNINGTDINPDLQSVVYCNGLRTADEATFNFIMNKLEKSLDQGERTLLISALGCSQNSALLNIYLSKALTTTFRLQERQRVLTAVTVTGNTGLDLTMDFIVKNAKTMEEMISPDSVGQSISTCASYVSSDDQFKKLQATLDSLLKSEHISKDLSESAKKSAQENLNLRVKIDKEVGGWLKTHYKGSGSAISLSLILLVAALVSHFLR